MPNFFGELKQRNVYKVAAAYAVVSWLLIQIATQVFPFFEIPNWAVRLVVLLLMLGFPVALILAWVFELTPAGIKRTEDVWPNESIRYRTGQRIIGITLTLAVIAAGLLAFRLSRSTNGVTSRQDETTTGSRTAPSAISEKSIAVLPFENLTSDNDNGYFAPAFQDEILARLSKIADLKVISRTSTQHYKTRMGMSFSYGPPKAAKADRGNSQITLSNFSLLDRFLHPTCALITPISEKPCRLRSDTSRRT